MRYHYITSGTCTKAIELEINEGKVFNVTFVGGCHGNTQGICSLIDGMEADEAIKRLRGIRCGQKSTSCPDQLACAIAEALQA